MGELFGEEAMDALCDTGLCSGAGIAPSGGQSAEATALPASNPLPTIYNTPTYIRGSRMSIWEGRTRHLGVWPKRACDAAGR